MTPLLWFLAGACFGAFCGVVLMALVAVSKEADAELDRWAGDIVRVEDLGVGNGANSERQLWVNRGPYDYREGL